MSTSGPKNRFFRFVPVTNNCNRNEAEAAIFIKLNEPKENS